MKSPEGEKIKQLLGAELRKARLSQFFTMADIADKVGVSRKTVYSWEVGRSFIDDLGIVAKLEKILKIRVWQIMEKAMLEVEAEKRKNYKL